MVFRDMEAQNILGETGKVIRQRRKLQDDIPNIRIDYSADWRASLTIALLVSRDISNL